MKQAKDQGAVALATLVTVIAHSQIMLPRPLGFSAYLPAGYDAVDIAVLDWIAAEGRRAGRALVRM